MKFYSLLLICLALPGIARQADTRQPFTITIATDNPEVSAGSNVCVKVSLTNNSSADLQLSGGASGYTGLDPSYRFEVRDQGGNLVQQRVYPPPKVRPWLYSYTLQPNEAHTQDQCPSALYDMRTPGQYTIQAFRRASNNTPQGGEVASNIIDVTVLPAASGEQRFAIVVAPITPTFKAGTYVCVLVNLINSSQDLAMNYVSVNGMDAEFRYEVRDESGNLIPKKAHQYPSTLIPRGSGTLKGNDTFSIEQCPSMLFDMSTPGKYTIQVFRQKSNDPKDGEIGSNIVTVTVVP
ncbi:MAG: hypothetical protein ACRD40_11895 [Candidatus Acidiferrales bacterium]